MEADWAQYFQLTFSFYFDIPKIHNEKLKKKEAGQVFVKKKSAGIIAGV
jgi:hypothetical protein